MSAPRQHFVKDFIRYNTLGPGFNPTPDFTLTGPDNINEGETATFSVRAFGLKAGTEITWQVSSVSNISNGRFSSQSGTVALLNGYHGAFEITISADQHTAIAEQSYTVGLYLTDRFIPTLTKTVIVNDTSQSPPLIFSIDASDTNCYPGTGTTITDLTANGYSPFSMLNGCGWTPQNNGAWSFDGVDDYIDTNLSLSASGSFTLNAWFKADTDVTDYRMIIGKENFAGAPWNYRMWLEKDTGRMVCDIVQGQLVTSIVLNEQYNLNVWTMATFVRNTSTGNVDLYINGTYKKSSTDSTTNPADSQVVWIGRSPFQGGRYPFKGLITDIKIYTEARSSGDISAYYNATKGRYGY